MPRRRRRKPLRLWVEWSAEVAGFFAPIPEEWRRPRQAHLTIGARHVTWSARFVMGEGSAITVRARHTALPPPPSRCAR